MATEISNSVNVFTSAQELAQRVDEFVMAASSTNAMVEHDVAEYESSVRLKKLSSQISTEQYEMLVQAWSDYRHELITQEIFAQVGSQVKSFRHPMDTTQELSTMKPANYQYMTGRRNRSTR